MDDKTLEEFTLVLTIKVEEAEACSVSTNPPMDTMIAEDQINDLFSNGVIGTRTGEYVFQISARGAEAISLPDGITQEEEIRLGLFLGSKLIQWFRSLRQAHATFPDAQTIEAIVEYVLNWTTRQELTEQNLLNAGFPLPALAENFHFELACFECDFQDAVARAQYMEVVQIGSMKIGLRKQEEQTFIHIGFLSHENSFADYFGNQILEAIRAALTPEAIRKNAMKFAVEGEHLHRQGALMSVSAIEQFRLDPREIMALVDQEVLARAQAPETWQRGFIDLSGEDFMPDPEEEDFLDLSLTSRRRIH